MADRESSTRKLQIVDCPAYVLAGGESRRFGSNKLQHRIDGRRQLDRILDFLAGEGFATSIVVKSAEVGDQVSVPVVTDAVGKGPIAGLHAAAANRKEVRGEGWFLLVPGDQFVWRPAWFSLLSEATAATAFASIFGDADDRLQPLPGLYHTRCLKPLNDSIASGELGLCKFLDILRSNKTVCSDEPGRTRPVSVLFASDQPQAVSFNTRDELRRLQRDVGED